MDMVTKVTRALRTVEAQPGAGTPAGGGLVPPRPPRKRKTAVGSIGEVPDFSSVIQSESLSLAQKRKKILEELGLKKTKRKYATPAERKTAAEKRRAERRETRLEALKRYGLEPQKKGPKMSKEQRSVKRSERGKVKREFLREMAKTYPDLAKKYGIDPNRFRL